MTFAFNAVGDKEEVIGQLNAAAITAGEDRFNLVALEVRDLLVNHFTHEAAAAYNGGEYRYAVKASGHGGGSSPLSLHLTVEPLYVQVPAAEDSVPDDDTGAEFD